MNHPSPLGDVLDGLGLLTEHLTDDQLVESAVVLVKIVDCSGQPQMRCTWTPGLAWLERVGMLAIAHDQELRSGQVND